MGASAYRWFQDGCCECVGQNCINYGINECRCMECSYGDDGDVDESELSDEELQMLLKKEEEEIEEKREEYISECVAEVVISDLQKAAESGQVVIESDDYIL